MRNLLRRLGDEGRTVLVSSHILSEVQQTCDHVTVIAHGRTIRTGSVQDLLQHGSSKYRIAVPGGEREQHPPRSGWVGNGETSGPSQRLGNSTPIWPASPGGKGASLQNTDP